MNIKSIMCAFIYFLVLAILVLAVTGSSEAEQSIAGSADILGQSLFEAEGSAFVFSNWLDTNFDSITVGNDKANAVGSSCGSEAKAQNNLEIKKNQDSGVDLVDIDNCSPCGVKYNLEQIEIGDREALAIGSASAINYIKIVSNQQ